MFYRSVVRIRRATHEDIDAVRAVGLGTWPQTYGYAGDQYVADGLRRWWSVEAIERVIREHTTLVAEQDGRVVGVTNLDVSTDPPTVWKLYVLPAFHHRGIGSQLLDAVIDALPADATALQLDVMQGNDPAFAFYRRRGFVATGHVQPPDRPDWPPTVWMQLTLDSDRRM